MDTKKKTKIVILGGGTAGWIAAAALSKQLSEVIDITLIESKNIETIGVGEASIPTMRVFHHRLGIDEKEFMQATGATFKLGIQFENWGDIDDQYIHAFGKTGHDTWMANFVHFWLRGRKLGIAKEFGEYCPEWAAAKSHRFSTQAQPNLNYAYHLDAAKYAKFLRGLAEKAGVVRVEDDVVGVQQDYDTGNIETLILKDHEKVSGDIFIDCSGFNSFLMDRTLRVGFQDWSHWLGCDRAVAVQSEGSATPPPFTRSIAHQSGWRWKIPLQSRTGNGSVYCSSFMSDDEACSKLIGDIDGKAINDPRLIKFRTGRRLEYWKKNVVALGLSSGFVEPLESTSIHLIMTGIMRFIQLFSPSGPTSSQIAEYNRQSIDEIEKIRDFIILHYKATNRKDSPFWRYCSSMQVPDALSHRMELFDRHAQTIHFDSDLFHVDSWIQVMLGQGIQPKGYHPIADIMPKNELNHFFDSLARKIHLQVNSIGKHHEFISSYCLEKQ